MGYALQWFAMAATLLVIYVVVNLKKESHDND
jgi:cytochrome oxidase assembly protein ShyY1